MNFILPELSIYQKFGNRPKKNIVKHLIHKESIRNCKILSFERTNLILKDGQGKKYFITSNKSNIPENQKYVAQCRIFKNQDIEDGNIVITKWLKHPDLKEYSPTEIKQSWEDTFTFKKENQENNILGLRTPQIGAIHSLLGHLTNSKAIATVVLPTGTGKTETMLSVLVANQCNKLLVTVPSDSLRTQLGDKFFNLGLLKVPDSNGKCILKPNAKFPIVGVLNTGFDNKEDLELFFSRCNVIISTMDLLTKSCSLFEQTKISEICSHFFVDEAHHSKAGNWDKFIKKFDKKKVVQYTATPYRNDGQLLDGETIYNFTLKEAQEQGYFKVIDFVPIREYDKIESDIKIAETAVFKLREDIENGFDHILMARCENKNRAKDVFDIYSKYDDLNPILIHSSIAGKTEIKKRIVNKEHKIIVCVDMLGEGFDLPELKVAAFHDIRKSLPITLQFAGRFTRTSRDAKLGNASFIANLYQPNIDDELSLLYSKNSNWNSILPTLSQQATQEQIDLQEFLSDFQNIEDSVIPYQDVKPAFSSVVYKNQTNEWFPSNFFKGIKGYDNYDYKFFDINSSKKTLIVFLGGQKSVDWGDFKDVYNIEWSIYIAYWEQRENALFIHSSTKGSDFKELAKAIIGDDATQLKDGEVFKVFHNVDRVKLFNVGLRKGLGKDISFQSYYGRGVQDALSDSEEKSSIKNNVFGVGFENGEVTSMGCSRKGKIWSYSRGTINEFTSWCDEVSAKLFNSSIDPDQMLLKNTIKPQKIDTRPNLIPISVDWHPSIYKETEDRTSIRIVNEDYDLSNCELTVFEASLDGNLKFRLETDDKALVFEKELSLHILNGESIYDFKINKNSINNASVRFGSKTFDTIEAFFNQYPPIFWFADGSYLQGYEYVNFNEDILAFPKEDIISWDWGDVKLNQESEKFVDLRKTSIQYFCFQKFLEMDYDIIYNDDDSGEIADIITIKNLDESIEVELYHLKFALEGKVSNQIKNFYEVCGQAQKSLIWKYKDGREFIDHLIKREHKKNKVNQTRLKKGVIEDLDNLLDVVKRTKPVNFDIYIVQPSLSKANPSDSILNLLGVTANHIKKEGGINLKVIASS
jgi:superfamily II DNA or RNA helicase